MPYIARDYIVNFSSGATASPALRGMDDAQTIACWTPFTTGGFPYTLQAEPSDTGTSWMNLLYNTSGGSAQILTSSGVLLVTNVAFRQMRFTSTAAVNSTSTVLSNTLPSANVYVVKQITV